MIKVNVNSWHFKIANRYTYQWDMDNVCSYVTAFCKSVLITSLLTAVFSLTATSIAFYGYMLFLHGSLMEPFGWFEILTQGLATVTVITTFAILVALAFLMLVAAISKGFSKFLKVTTQNFLEGDNITSGIWQRFKNKTCRTIEFDKFK
jgi:hypothetical protein